MLVKRSISIKGHRTSYSLEPEFHTEITRIAEEKGVPLARLIARLDSKRDENTNLSSTLRLYVLEDLKKQSGEPQ